MILGVGEEVAVRKGETGEKSCDRLVALFKILCRRGSEHLRGRSHLLAGFLKAGSGESGSSTSTSFH